MTLPLFTTATALLAERAAVAARQSATFKALPFDREAWNRQAAEYGDLERYLGLDTAKVMRESGRLD